MFFITKENLNSLLLGSLFLGTGGGLTLRKQREIYEKLLIQKNKLLVKEVDEFEKQDYLASVYGVGDPSKAQVDFKNLLQQSLKEYKKLTGIKIKGIIPGEIGAESLAFQAAAYANLPVVDSDLVGGRAAPEIQMDVFTVYNLFLTPLLAVSFHQKSLLFIGKFSAKEIENELRQFFQKNRGAGILIGYPVEAGQYGKIGMKNTIFQAIRIGEYLQRKDIESLLKHFNGRLVDEAILREVKLESGGDFFKGWAFFENGWKLWIKNENILLMKNNKIKIASPAIIVLLDSKKQPIHNSELKKHKGKKISIISLPAQGYWRNPTAQKIWRSAYPTSS